MDLKNLLLKTSPELNTSEKEFIKQHEAELGQEDRDAYADFLSSTIEDNSATEDTPAEEIPAATETPATPETPEAPVTPAFTFKSEDEAKDFFKKLQREQDVEKQKAIDAAKTPEEKKYVEDNWKPDDWNQGLRKAVEIVKSELKAEQEAKDQAAAVKFWEDQWTDLSKEKGLKPITTPEGKQVHDQIVYLMRGFGLKTFKEGHAAWEKANGAINGSPVVTPSEAGAALAKAKGDLQRKAASKIGAANAGEQKPVNTTGVKPFASYEELKKAKSRGILTGL